jgi:hypothetical protein
MTSTKKPPSLKNGGCNTNVGDGSDAADRENDISPAKNQILPPDERLR